MGNRLALSKTVHLNVLHAVLSLDCGGLERLVLHLCKESITAGDRVTVLCLDHPGELAEEVRKTGAEVISLNRKPGLMRLPEAVRLRKILKRAAPDVIHCHQMGATLYVGTTARTLHVPAILHTEHGNHDYSSWRQRLLATIAFRTPDKICCVSQDIANNLVKYRLAARKNLDIQVNGIPLPTARQLSAAALAREQLGIDRQAIIYGSVGRLARVKRQERLLEAMATLTRRGRKVHLVLVGDGPQRNELERTATRLGISQRVHFAGFQLDPLPYIALLDIFVLTSESEGMPMSLLEAWAARKPVVVTAVGGLPELVDDGKTGLLLPPGEQEQLVETLASLAADPQHRRYLGDNGHALVTEKYSVEKIARTYRDRYLSLLHQQ